MRDDKVIIDYDRHKVLLEKEELWDKYKKEHTYGGIITAIVANYRNAREYLEFPVDRIESSFSPNTPEEVQEMLIKEVGRLEIKLDIFKEECATERKELEARLKESLGKIPSWIKNMYI